MFEPVNNENLDYAALHQGYSKDLINPGPL